MAVDSACSNCLPSFKFVGDTFSASALIGLVTLTFDLLMKLVHVIAHEVGNLLNNFDVLGTFRSRSIGQARSRGPSDTCDLDL